MNYSPRNNFENKVVNRIWKTELTNATYGPHILLTTIFQER